MVPLVLNQSTEMTGASQAGACRQTQRPGRRTARRKAGSIRIVLFEALFPKGPKYQKMEYMASLLGIVMMVWGTCLILGSWTLLAPNASRLGSKDCQKTGFRDPETSL